MIVAVLATALAAVILLWAPRTAGGLQDDVLALEPNLPEFVMQVVYGVYAVLLIGLAVAIMVWVIGRRRWRLLTLFLITTIVASVMFTLLGSWIAGRLPALSPDVNESSILAILDPTNDLGWVASLAAGLAVTRPWVPTKWYRLGWVLLLCLLPARLLLPSSGPHRPPPRGPIPRCRWPSMWVRRQGSEYEERSSWLFPFERCLEVSLEGSRGDRHTVRRHAEQRSGQSALHHYGGLNSSAGRSDSWPHRRNWARQHAPLPSAAWIRRVVMQSTPALTGPSAVDPVGRQWTVLRSHRLRRRKRPPVLQVIGCSFPTPLCSFDEQ